jgi:DNA repair protein RadC
VAFAAGGIRYCVVVEATMNLHLTVHDLPKAERPRERMVSVGPAGLSAHELLALVLGNGVQGENVLVTAQKLLVEFGSLEGVLNASLQDLQRMRGMGVAKSTQLKACLEIARRVSVTRIEDTVVVMRPDDVYKLVRAQIVEESKEHFVVLSFDVRNRFIGMDVIAVGTLSGSLIHPREVFEAGIKRHAARIAVAHNHPSGDCTPSDEDHEVTKKLVEAGKIMGITLVDHVVVCKDRYYSFADEGLV